MTDGDALWDAPTLGVMEGDDDADGGSCDKSTAMLAINGLLALPLNVFPDVDTAHTTFVGAVCEI